MKRAVIVVKKESFPILSYLRICLIIISLFIFIAGCSSQNDKAAEQANTTEQKEDREALYGEALLDLHDDNTTDIQKDLDKRFRSLERQIDRLLDGQQELGIAQFTRIKIELDYLQMRNYDAQNLSRLSKKFQSAYTKAEVSAKESAEGITGSLGDRYSTLNRTISRISQGELELTVAQYLEVEKGLDDLQEDGYMIPARIQSLRQQLLKAVIYELENAIVDVQAIQLEEMGEMDEEEAKEAEEKEAEEAASSEEFPSEESTPEEPEQVEVSTGPQTYVVNLIDGGFDQSKVSIKAGDTVEWKNARKGRYKIGFVIGNGKCRGVNSGIFKEGLSYSWTFTEPGLCLVADGIYTTQAMKVVVS